MFVLISQEFCYISVIMEIQAKKKNLLYMLRWAMKKSFVAIVQYLKIVIIKELGEALCTLYVPNLPQLGLRSHPPLSPYHRHGTMVWEGIVYAYLRLRLGGWVNWHISMLQILDFQPTHWCAFCQKWALLDLMVLKLLQKNKYKTSQVPSGTFLYLEKIECISKHCI